MLEQLRISDAVRMKRIIDEDQLSFLSWRAFSAGFTAAVNYYKVTPSEYDGYDAGQLWSEWNDELWQTETDGARIVALESTEKVIAPKDATMNSMIKEILAQ